MTNATPHTLILGGGIAGIAAGVRLAQQGKRVTLIETAKRLGGRATSFTDPATGETLDNCQHVVLRCCTNLLDLYDRLGVRQHIEWHKTFYFLDGRGNLDRLESAGLIAPFHLTRSLMGFATFSLADKIAIGRAMLSLMRLGNRRTEWHDRSFGDWLRAQQQPSAVIERFWSPVVVSAINAWPDDCAADYAMQVFQEAFCANAEAYHMGLSRVPLARLYDAAADVIGDVRLGAAVSAIDIENNHVTAVRLTNGETLHAARYISALPFDRFDKVTGGNRFADVKHSPILGIHLWFDGEVTDLPHVALTQSPLQWLFNKGGGYLHAVISAADAFVDQSPEAIIAMADAEVRKAFPKFRGHLQNARVIKEKRATYLLSPGFDQYRLPAQTNIADNLTLAGDWTDTGWPATMEGAARSGYLAAGVELEPDLPGAALVRWMALMQ